MPRQGNVLEVTRGTWLNVPRWYSFQWRRCDASGWKCTPIEGANQQMYVATNDDVGHTLRVVVAASNHAGVAYSRTDATDVVAPRPFAPSPPTGPGG